MPAKTKRFLYLEQTDSTQNALREALEAGGAHEELVIYAGEQTKGRGMAGNYWLSEKGMNLTFSTVWWPSFLPAHDQFCMSMAVAVAIRRFTEVCISDRDIRIKWPNDIYADGKKISGMLIENVVQGGVINRALIGIGLNVNQCVFPPEIPDAVSLKMLTGKDYDLGHLLAQIVESLDESYKRLRYDRHGIMQEYLSYLYRRMEWSVYGFRDGHKEARVTGVDEFGHLLLELRNGSMISCDLKEVTFIR